MVGSCSTVVGSCSTAWEVVALHCTEDRDVRAFFFRDKDSLFFLAGGASEGSSASGGAGEGSSASGGAGEGSSASKNQPSGNKFPSPSIFKKTPADYKPADYKPVKVPSTLVLYENYWAWGKFSKHM